MHPLKRAGVGEGVTGYALSNGAVCRSGPEIRDLEKWYTLRAFFLRLVSRRGETKKIKSLKLTGQNNLNYIKILTGQDHLCRFCEESEETFNHLFLECPCFETLRRSQNLHCSRTHRWKIQTLLNFANTKSIDRALRHSGNNSDSE